MSGDTGNEYKHVMRSIEKIEAREAELYATPTRKPDGEGWVWGKYRVKGTEIWAWKRRGEVLR